MSLVERNRNAIVLGTAMGLQWVMPWGRELEHYGPRGPQWERNGSRGPLWILGTAWEQQWIWMTQRVMVTIMSPEDHIVTAMGSRHRNRYQGPQLDKWTAIGRQWVLKNAMGP